MKVKKLENLWNKIGLICCKWSNLNAPGTEKTCALLRLGEFHFPIFSLPLFGVIRIGLSSIKVKKFENLGNKIRLTNCKWSSLNVPGTQSLYFTQIGRIPFSHFQPPSSGVIRNGLTSMWVKKLKILWNKMGSTGCKWSSLNVPGIENPLSHSFLGLGELPFPNNDPLG